MTAEGDYIKKLTDRTFYSMLYALENDWGWRSGQSPRFRRYSP